MRWVGCLWLALASVVPALGAEWNVPRFLASREPLEGSAERPPAQWTAGENVRWKTELPGLGWSSPIVWEGKIFVTSCEKLGPETAPRKGLYLEDLDANKYPPDTTEHVWRVYCLDLATGAIDWQHEAHRGPPPKPHHIKNTLASETPTTDGERLYAYFGNVGMFCYRLDGQPLWQHPVTATETQLGWGTSISPVVHQGRVYLVNDNEEASYLACLEGETGKELWRIARDEKTNYATPFVWETPQRTELVISGIKYARSYDLEGKLLWQLKGRSILAIPTPFARFGNLYLTSGHVMWGENPFYCIRPGASGDLSPDPEGKGPLPDGLVWHLPKAGPYHPTPLVVGEQLYVLYDRGLLASWNAKTGAEVYSRKRIPEGRAFTSSPWTDGERLYAINEDGVTFVLQTGPEFAVLGTNPLAEDEMCMASPVVLGSRLLIRTAARLYCLEEGAEKQAAK